jgi:3-hydroxy-D-aspartate aldolase
MMTSQGRGMIGRSIDEIDTPALVVDLDAFERNLDLMARRFPAGGQPVLRPHAKPHKSPAIAAMQVARGAIGVCCQTVDEAQVMVDGGIGDVLLTNVTVSPAKLSRLAALARRARVELCVDNPLHIELAERAAAAADGVLHARVEINVGGNRCGVQPGGEAVPLAQAILAAHHLRFTGLQAYSGNAQHEHDHAQRVARCQGIARDVAATRAALAAAGIDVQVVGGAGTGTWDIDADLGTYTEIQAGSYLFMDGYYLRNRGADGRADDRFAASLFVLGTVVSSARRGHAVIDVGTKTIGTDRGLPQVADRDDLTVTRISDEHIVLEVRGAALRLGERVRLVAGNCEPTVNLHNHFVGVRGGRVESAWPILRAGVRVLPL